MCQNVLVLWHNVAQCSFVLQSVPECTVLWHNVPQCNCCFVQCWVAAPSCVPFSFLLQQQNYSSTEWKLDILVIKNLMISMILMMKYRGTKDACTYRQWWCPNRFQFYHFLVQDMKTVFRMQSTFKIILYISWL